MNGVPDTRERIEADAWEAARLDMSRTWEERRDAIVALLDRQAALSERETKLRELYKFEENHREHVRSIEEVNQQLNERIAELRDELDHARSCPDCDCCGWKEKVDELQAELDELRPSRIVEFAELESDEPPYDELLRCLENDWHISASWDGLRKFWNVADAELDHIEDKSRWFELFGTPERAARTLLESTSECRCCVIRDECGYDLDACVMYDHDKLLEWLRGDAE